MNLIENSSIMATIRECQGKAMDAQAVADRIYKEHSIVATEEEVLHAQAWLQEERKLTETPPAHLPVQAPVREPVNVASKVEDGGRVGTVPAVVDTPASPKDADVKLVIPEGVSKIPPFRLLMIYTTAGTTASYWCFQCA